MFVCTQNTTNKLNSTRFCLIIFLFSFIQFMFIIINFSADYYASDKTEYDWMLYMRNKYNCLNAKRLNENRIIYLLNNYNKFNEKICSNYTRSLIGRRFIKFSISSILPPVCCVRGLALFWHKITNDFIKRNYTMIFVRKDGICVGIPLNFSFDFLRPTFIFSFLPKNEGTWISSERTEASFRFEINI